MRGGVLLFVEDNLRQSRAIAQINKNQVAEIAPPVNPAHQDDLFAVIASAKIAAVMRSLQCSE
jgi:hypothetical protein